MFCGWFPVGVPRRTQPSSGVPMTATVLYVRRIVIDRISPNPSATARSRSTSAPTCCRRWPRLCNGTAELATELGLATFSRATCTISNLAIQPPIGSGRLHAQCGRVVREHVSLLCATCAASLCQPGRNCLVDVVKSTLCTHVCIIHLALRRGES